MLATGKCLGCNKLELPFFETDKKCEYAKNTLEEGKQIRIDLEGIEKNNESI